MQKILLLCMALLTLGNSSGQVAELVKDVTPGADDSYIIGLAACSGKLYFTLSTQQPNEYQAWVSDGTAAGTKRLLNTETSINPNFTAFNGKTYFEGPDTLGGSTLWVTDGTDAGTMLFWDGTPNAKGAARIINVYNSRLYFAGTFNGRTELWYTDGTLAGTQRIQAGSMQVAAISESIVAGGRLFFEGHSAAFANELWITDGTNTGTNMVKDIAPGGGGSSVRAFTAVNNRVFFVGREGNNSLFDLFVSDGTDTGTGKVVDLPIAANSRFRDPFAAYNDKLYFIVDTGPGFHLWVTDGTTAGTMQVEDDVERVWVYNSQLFFLKNNATLYQSNGGKNAGVAVTNLDISNFQSWPLNFAEVNGRLYFTQLFTHLHVPTRYNLWHTDGTAANTGRILSATGNGTTQLAEPEIAELNGNLYFIADDDSLIGAELYMLKSVSTGTADIAADTEIQLYPNPTGNHLQVLSTATPLTTVEIANIKGQLVYSSSSLNTTSHSINIVNYSAGIYFARITTATGGFRVIKFMRK